MADHTSSGPAAAAVSGSTGPCATHAPVVSLSVHPSYSSVAILSLDSIIIYSPGLANGDVNSNCLRCSFHQGFGNGVEKLSLILARFERWDFPPTFEEFLRYKWQVQPQQMKCLRCSTERYKFLRSSATMTQ
jgi:hypothetical protein